MINIKKRVNSGNRYRFFVWTFGQVAIIDEEKHEFSAKINIEEDLVEELRESSLFERIKDEINRL